MAPWKCAAPAQAFITMRERIERMSASGTEMLAGVSHDLKTPLTRLKLTLAMMPDDADAESMRADIAEMDICWTTISPSHGEKAARTPALPISANWCARAAAAAERARPQVQISVTAPHHVPVSVAVAPDSAGAGQPDRNALKAMGSRWPCG